uniref:Envelope glycoprotein n=3 Tax=Equus asinus TaxID=9793 RepID=A0A9L0IUQ5_EQUAS|nr:endogenous retrovirus group PABLB member 1 Env polyprotein-like [Equus asinus]XP_044599705.1 endogenous retrovirus group PABLB member 1 Env polyprotein-like [Equus asinus]
MWLGSQRCQSPGTWLICQILEGCLVGWSVANNVVDWAHTYAEVANVSNCWVCTELPSSAAEGLPWHIYPASEGNWNWLRSWGPADAQWDQRRRQVDQQFHRQRGHTWPWVTPSLWDGYEWLPGEAVVLRTSVPLCIEQQKGNAIAGWVPEELCQKIQRVTRPKYWWNARPYVGTVPIDRVPAGSLWVCGHYGWPYLPANWTGRCTWGWPYLPATVRSTLDVLPSNWERVKGCYHREKQTPWWFYPLTVLSPSVETIAVEWQVTALAEYTTRALNHTTRALSLLTDAVDQTWKVVLQNRMALDILTAAQEGTCAVIEVQCCMFIPDNARNISHALQKAKEISWIQTVTRDPLKKWWSKLSFSCRSTLATLGGIACLLAVVCCSLYCCCKMWVQGTGLYGFSSFRLRSLQKSNGGRVKGDGGTVDNQTRAASRQL